MEVHHQARLKSTKTGISSEVKTLASPKTENLRYFLWGKVYITRLYSAYKVWGFWFKN